MGFSVGRNDDQPVLFCWGVEVETVDCAGLRLDYDEIPAVRPKQSVAELFRRPVNDAVFPVRKAGFPSPFEKRRNPLAEGKIIPRAEFLLPLSPRPLSRGEIISAARLFPSYGEQKRTLLSLAAGQKGQAKSRVIGEKKGHGMGREVARGEALDKSLFTKAVTPLYRKRVRKSEIFPFARAEEKVALPRPFEGKSVQSAVQTAPRFLLVDGQDVFPAAESKPPSADSVGGKEDGVAVQKRLRLARRRGFGRAQNLRARFKMSEPQARSPDRGKLGAVSPCAYNDVIHGAPFPKAGR